MSTDVPTSSSLNEFVAVWGMETAHDVATALTCIEVDALACLLRAHGYGDLAEVWLAEHSRADDLGDVHYRAEAIDRDGG